MSLPFDQESGGKISLISIAKKCGDLTSRAISTI
jgi:hypothetical protein